MDGAAGDCVTAGTGLGEAQEARRADATERTSGDGDAEDRPAD